MTNTKLRELVSAESFKEILISELYSLIDEEMLKLDEMDCDLVDQLVEAIEKLEQCDNEKLAVVIPLIFANGTALSKHIRNKVNGRKLALQITSVAAAIALIISSMNSIPTKNGESVLVYALNEIVQQFEEIFGVTSNSTENSTEAPEDTENQENQNELESEEEQPVGQAVELVKIELVSDDNFKSSYLWREKLNLDGLHVMAIYSDDSTVEIPLSECEITGYDSTKVGIVQKITVKYKNVTAVFRVTVSKTEKNDLAERTITDVEIKPDKVLVLPKGTENPVAELKYRYTYSDGTVSPFKTCNSSDVKLISKYDNQLLDVEQTLKYEVPKGFTFTVKVVLYDDTVEASKQVKAIGINSRPKELLPYVRNTATADFLTFLGEPCDFSQWVFRIRYEDDTFEDVSLSEGKVKAYGTMTTDELSSQNGHVITFAYGGCELEVKYDVVKRTKLTSYEPYTSAVWQTYHIDDAPKEFNANSLVQGKFKGISTPVLLNIDTVGYDPTQIGLIKLQASYRGQDLGEILGGYIYEDNSWFVRYQPITEYTPTEENFNYYPELEVFYFTEKGKPIMTVDEFVKAKGFDYNDDWYWRKGSVKDYFDAVGIYNWMNHASYYQFSARVRPYNYRDSSVPIYQEYYNSFCIKEFGEYEVAYRLYDVEKDENGKYIRGDVAFECSYTLKVNEGPVDYRIEAPNNLYINIKDINWAFYDKVKVYGIYADGSEKEIQDYQITQISPDHNIKSDYVAIQIVMPDNDSYTGEYRYLYLYSTGYEDAWYITLREENYTKTFYEVGTEKPKFQLIFNSSQGGEHIIYHKSDEVTLNGWDSNTPGKHTLKITYHHSQVGDLVTEMDYYVRVCQSSIKVTVPENMYYNPADKTISTDFDVEFTNSLGETCKTKDYTWQLISTSTYGDGTISNKIKVSCKDPYSKEIISQEVWVKNIPPVCEPSIKVTMPEGTYYDFRTGKLSNEYTVEFTDSMGEKRVVTDYKKYIDKRGTVPKNGSTIYDLEIEYQDPYSAKWIKKIVKVPAPPNLITGITAKRDESGNIILTVHNDLPEADNVEYDCYVKVDGKNYTFTSKKKSFSIGFKNKDLTQIEGNVTVIFYDAWGKYSTAGKVEGIIPVE